MYVCMYLTITQRVLANNEYIIKDFKITTESVIATVSSTTAMFLC